jgi:hypothetical protein
MKSWYLRQTWMSFEDIMISEIIQVQKDKNTTHFHSYMKAENVHLIEVESKIVLTRGWER